MGKPWGDGNAANEKGKVWKKKRGAWASSKGARRRRRGVDGHVFGWIDGLIEGRKKNKARRDKERI